MAVFYVAHAELLDASQNLVQLADWCDENFSDEGSKDQVNYNTEDKKPSKLYGGKTLKTTGQFAIQVAYRIRI